MKNLIISYLVFISISIAAIIGCTIAGIDIFKDNTGDTSHEHSYGEWQTVEEASCIKTGLKERSCECGEKESEEIALADHNYVSAVTDPTCTENGYTTHTCSVCSDSYTDSETESAGHNYVSEVTDPTCTDKGYTTHTCSVCGDSYTDSETESAGHNYASEVTDPTCTDKGYTTHTCSVCGDFYTDAETESTGHSYTSEVTDPTCTDKGYTTHTCSVCGDSYTDSEVAASGHVAGESKVVTEPTCTDEGFTTYTCNVCGENYVDNYTAPAHTYGAWEIKVDGDLTDSYERSCECGASQTMTGVPKASEDLLMEYSAELDGYIVMGRGGCKDTDIVIPATHEGKNVVAINDYAFMSDSTMTSITIIGGVENIGQYAFASISVLKNIYILGGVKNIDVQAFSFSYYVETIVISDSVTSIKLGAFALFTTAVGTPLPTVYYTGTANQWTKIEIGEENLEISDIDNTINYNYIYGE